MFSSFPAIWPDDTSSSSDSEPPSVGGGPLARKANERHRHLVRFNDTACSHPQQVCLHELVTLQATQTPAAVAVEGPTTSLTYQALDEGSNQIAHLLQSHGAAPGTYVGLLMSSSVERVVAVLGTLKAGAAYVPLSPTPQNSLLPNGRTLTAVLTEGSLVDRFATDVDTPLLCVDRDRDVASAAAARGVTRSTSPDELASVRLGAGLEPVALSHRTLANQICWLRDRSSAGPGDRTLQWASPGTPAFVQELFSTWSTGGCLVLPSLDAPNDATTLLRTLADQSIHRLFVSAPTLHRLAGVAATPPSLPLREIHSVGAPLQMTPALASLLQQCPDCVLEAQYGRPHSPLATAYRRTGPVEDWDRRALLGRPIANARVYLLDADRQLVTQGEPGEVHVGGDVLARGALDAPAWTSDRFWPDPFSEAPGARLYRTGDRARHRPGGILEFLGRLNPQGDGRGLYGRNVDVTVQDAG